MKFHVESELAIENNTTLQPRGINTGMFITKFRGGSGGLGGVFSSKLAPVDCKTDREIDREQLEYGLKFLQKMTPNGLRENWKLLINMPE